MKKVTLALSLLMALGLAACSANNAEQTGNFKGQILASSFQDGQLKLTVRKDNCEANSQASEVVDIIAEYNSTLVVGACVAIMENGQTIKNVSTLTPRSL